MTIIVSLWDHTHIASLSSLYMRAKHYLYIVAKISLMVRDILFCEEFCGAVPFVCTFIPFQYTE